MQDGNLYVVSCVRIPRANGKPKIRAPSTDLGTHDTLKPFKSLAFWPKAGDSGAFNGDAQLRIYSFRQLQRSALSPISPLAATLRPRTTLHQSTVLA